MIRLSGIAASAGARLAPYIPEILGDGDGWSSACRCAPAIAIRRPAPRIPARLRLLPRICITGATPARHPAELCRGVDRFYKGSHLRAAGPSAAASVSCARESRTHAVGHRRQRARRVPISTAAPAP